MVNQSELIGELKKTKRELAEANNSASVLRERVAKLENDIAGIIGDTCVTQVIAAVSSADWAHIDFGIKCPNCHAPNGVKIFRKDTDEDPLRYHEHLGFMLGKNGVRREAYRCFACNIVFPALSKKLLIQEAGVIDPADEVSKCH